MKDRKTELTIEQQRVMDSYDRNERKRDQRFRYFHKTVAAVDAVHKPTGKKGATDSGG